MWEKMMRQFGYEIAGWKRLLAFLKDENVHLRNRLSEVLSGDISSGMLEKAEFFQMGFLHVDEVINWLEREIALQERLLQRESFPGAEQVRRIVDGQEQLRKYAEKAEEMFYANRDGFQEFVESCYTDQPLA